MDSSLFRKIPQIEQLMQQPEIAACELAWSRSETIDALRAILGEVRDELRSGEPLPDFASAAFAERVRTALEKMREPSLKPLINATGIVIHTNLGRAPLAPAALDAIKSTAAGYTNIEYTLETGKRGSRYDHTRDLLCELTGAEDAIVVNNCAAAVTLCLATFAKDKEVIVSRGELIEIGGSFRVPDIIAQNGAVLKEVGTTNKTKLSDYEQAISENTAVLLKTHTSNYKIIGFTAKPALQELASLAEDHDLILIEDLGSGTLLDLSEYGIGDEPTVKQRISEGAHLLTFSGDKLLGGPQCGIITGRKDLIAQLKTNPLLRAMRIDKLSLAALEATLRLYKPPFAPEQEIPVLRMLTATLEDLEQKAVKLQNMLASQTQANTKVDRIEGEAGGGSLPGTSLPSFGVRLVCAALTPGHLIDALRRSRPPIIARITGGDVILDVRTISETDFHYVTDAIDDISQHSLSQ